VSAESILLANYIFPKLHIDANPRFDPGAHLDLLKRQEAGEAISDEDIPLPESKIDVRRVNPDAEHPQFIALQKITLESRMHPCVPYSIDIECVGQFEWPGPKLSDAEMATGVTRVAHTVLYGACREMVMNLTSRGPHGGFLLSIAILRPHTPADQPMPAAAPAAPENSTDR
jgi:hypothetical protein